MACGLGEFSRFVAELDARAASGPPDAAACWAAERLAGIVGFDCAWFGWADVAAAGVEIHASATMHLPDDYFAFWRTISDQDLLAARIWSGPRTVATYDRGEREQTEGMVALADRYGLRRFGTAMTRRPGRASSFFLSGYRGDPRAPAFDASEQEFLQCAVDQITIGLRRAARSGLEPDAVALYVSEAGVGLVGYEAARARLEEFWPGWCGDRLPPALAALLAGPEGEHILVDRGLVVSAAPAPGAAGLRRLAIRRLRPADRLTKRERSVAAGLAAGETHKETAGRLGLSPHTVRNQIRSIYAKLGVGSRAGLVRALDGAGTAPLGV